MKSKLVVVRAFPRIHIGLIDLAGATARKYGGAGFAISGPYTEIIMDSSIPSSIIGLEKLDLKGQDDVISVVERLNHLPLSKNTQITISKVAPQHIGLGGKTSLLLCLLTALHIHNGIKIQRTSIQKLSNRGGTSGVGINTFFLGGLITDCGQEINISSDFTPSSFASPTSIPPVVSRVRIPRQWRFHLILPQGERISGRRELDFFHENTPIPKDEALQMLALVYHGIVPAFATANTDLLKSSLDKAHDIGFKGKELHGQSIHARDLYFALRELPGCAIGLSSMGPLLYATVNSHNSLIAKKITDISYEFNASIIGVCQGRNKGYEVIYD
ncbi:beta-ribofuranosylaminobenzene 5'-phosphate synthase family protein [Candidatus Chloroploca asiatica]|uniref:beta-ribofuranosylaminobenzene 5'-phosphate synthase family protein n=1 Tax=Candidatus Chloroploca asiatica TaxID=1506545 RepID=UPI001558BC14|nr:beta-ribofuranosylaminobenzene 5'-phosphate synthase family protein [Candidatus Chloroploca asiatica]